MLDYSKFPHQRGTPPSGAGERQARHLDTLGTPSLHRLNPDGSVSRKVNGRLSVDPAGPAAPTAFAAGYEFWVNDDFRLYPGGLGSLGQVNVKPTDDDGVEILGEMSSDFAQGHAVHLTKAGKATARYSTSLAPGPGQSWPLVSPRRLTSLTPSHGATPEPGWFYSKWSWQDQKMAEHTWWKNNQGGYLLTSALGTACGLGNIAPQRAPGTTAYSYRSNYVLRTGGDRQVDPLMGDAGFDIKTCAYNRGGVFVGASRQQGPNVWYRRAAVQTVTLPGGGTRDYVIHSDTHGRFTIWPLGEYQNVEKYPELYADNPIAYADLPPSVAKVFLPPYPDWVSVPSTDGSVETEHWLWQFNKTATRCASVPHQRVEAWVWVWTRRLVNPTRHYVVGGRALMSDGHFNAYYATLGLDAGLGESAPGREADGSYRPDPNDNDWQYLRVREYRLKRDATGNQAFSRAYLIDGKLVGCSTETGLNPIANFDTREWKRVPNPANYEPAFTYLPGLVEFGIQITASDADPYDFSAAFTLLRDEPYEQSKRYRVDAAYYVATPRTRAMDAAAGLKDDDLLVAEVEVYFTPGQGYGDEGVVFPADPTANNTWKLFAGCQHAQGGPLLQGIVTAPVFISRRRFHDHIDEPYLESALTGRFRAAGVYAYYTVRRQESQAVVQRLCLVHNERWEFDGMDILTEFARGGPDQERAFTQADGTMVNYSGRVFLPIATSTTVETFEVGLARARYISLHHMPATQITMIDVADLRFLNFVTRTYQRAAAVPGSYSRLSTESGYKWQTQPLHYRYTSYVLPNHHLRVRGEAVRSILYTPDVPDLGADPAANLVTAPVGAVLLPSRPRGSAPCGNEGAALAMQQEFAARYITPSLLPGNQIHAHPGGHWAICLNRTQVELVYPDEGPPESTGELLAPLPASTEGAATWFDVIQVPGKPATTHRAVFNAAFGQERGYDFYADPDPDEDFYEFGGFVAGGIWIAN